MSKRRICPIFFFSEIFSKATQKWEEKKEHMCHLERAKPRGSSPKMRINVTPRSVRFFPPFLRFYGMFGIAVFGFLYERYFRFWKSPENFTTLRTKGCSSQKYFSRRSNLVVTEFLWQIRMPAIKYKINRANVSPWSVLIVLLLYFNNVSLLFVSRKRNYGVKLIYNIY